MEVSEIEEISNKFLANKVLLLEGFLVLHGFVFDHKLMRGQFSQNKKNTILKK